MILRCCALAKIIGRASTPATNPRKVIQCPNCETIPFTTTIERRWYCALHPPLKLKWIDPTLKNCVCGGEFKKVCESEHVCKSCGLIHQEEQSQAGPHAQYVPKSKYNMKYITSRNNCNDSILPRIRRGWS